MSRYTSNGITRSNVDISNSPSRPSNLLLDRNFFSKSSILKETYQSVDCTFST